jgi:hypothetical protein
MNSHISWELVGFPKGQKTAHCASSGCIFDILFALSFSVCCSISMCAPEAALPLPPCFRSGCVALLFGRLTPSGRFGSIGLNAKTDDVLARPYCCREERRHRLDLLNSQMA